MSYAVDKILQNICKQLEEFDSDDFDEFDIVFEKLYDWGDFNHKCWIKTYF